MATEGPVMEPAAATASDVGTYRHMPLIGATMAHFTSEQAERLAVAGAAGGGREQGRHALVACHG